MSKFDYDYNPEEKAKPSIQLERLDYISIAILLMALCVGGYFLAIFLSPNSALNPFPPKPVNKNASPTPTITPIGYEPTWTPSVTIEPTQASTLASTFTPLPSPTFFSLITPSITPTPTSTPPPTKTPKAPFTATVNNLQSDITIPHLQAFACNWMGVGGSVVDANNSDLIGFTIKIVGSLDGKRVGPDNYIATVSGISPDYGRSGFELKLSDLPIASKGTLYIQLFDQAGLPGSDAIYFDTFNDCAKNLVLVRFKKTR